MDRNQLADLLRKHDVSGNPRRCQQRFLVSIDAWDSLMDQTSWMKHSSLSDVAKRIAWVVSNESPVVPVCRVCHENPQSWNGKVFSPWCSVRCKNQDPEVRANISIKNHDNAETRNIKRANTLFKDGKTSPFQGHKHTVSTKLQIGLSSSISLAKAKLKFYKDHPDATFPSDVPHWASKGEKDVVNWLRDLGYDVKHKDHLLLDGKEADIYIPSHNFAIEYDGIWWHREDAELFSKQQKAAEKGVMLIRIFEDEWELKQPIVKSMILAKLGAFDHRYEARKLIRKDVKGHQARDFMQVNHIQGFKPAQSHIALVDTKDEIIAMVSLSKKNGLERFASKLNCQVIGGLTKLIHNKTPLFTYADRRFSPIAEKTGYFKIGKFIGSTRPGYFWVKNNHREPRWLFQKQLLQKKLGHQIDLSKTEDQIMMSEGYYKLYDCGHWKFLLNP